jgi:hypothetical protein
MLIKCLSTNQLTGPARRRSSSGVLRCIAVLVLVLAAACASASSAFAASGDADLLPAWSEGYFYIQHISTGRGNSTYFVFSRRDDHAARSSWEQGLDE